MATDKELKRLYQELRSTPKVAVTLGCTASGVARRLGKLGVFLSGGKNTRFKEGQPSPRRLVFDENELVRLYHEHKSTHRVAEALGCSQGAVYHALKRIRQPFVYKSHRPPAWNKSGLDVKDVVRVYRELGSATRTGTVFGVTRPVILRILREMKIPCPNRGLIKKGHVPWNKGLRGPRNSNWKHGFAALNESLRSLPEYHRWRQAVLGRDGHGCQSCGSERRLEAHHKGQGFTALLKRYKITTRAQAVQCVPLWRVSLGKTLCHDCHAETDTYKLCARERSIA